MPNFRRAKLTSPRPGVVEIAILPHVFFWRGRWWQRNNGKSYRLAIKGGAWFDTGGVDVWDAYVKRWAHVRP